MRRFAAHFGFQVKVLDVFFGLGGNSGLTPASLENAEDAERNSEYGRDAHATFKRRGGAGGVGLGRAFRGR